jgi:hypothetical protein
MVGTLIHLSLACGSCRAVFAFGQHKKGNTLFPKHEAGWHKWDRT